MAGGHKLYNKLNISTVINKLFSHDIIASIFVLFYNLFLTEIIMSEIVKKCKIHGELTLNKVRKDGKLFRCTACRIESNKKSYDANREKRIH